MRERAVRSDRWAPAREVLPDSLEELSGPRTGVVELPLHLAWSGLRAFDLGDDKLLLGAYRVVVNYSAPGGTKLGS